MISVELQSVVIKMVKRSTDVEDMIIRVHDFCEIHDLSWPTCFEMVDYGKIHYEMVKSDLGMAILG